MKFRFVSERAGNKYMRGTYAVIEASARPQGLMYYAAKMKMFVDGWAKCTGAVMYMTFLDLCC